MPKLKLTRKDKEVEEMAQDASEKSPKEKKQRKAKKESEGSRWAGVVLMIVTVLLSIGFLIAGEWSAPEWSFSGMMEWFSGGQGGTTFVLE